MSACPPPPDVFEAVVRDHRGFLRDAAVSAGHAIGLFRAVADAPAAVSALALRLGVGARRLRALTAVLALEGLLARAPDGAVLPAAAPPPPAALPDVGWGRLAAVLRSDRPLPPASDDDAVGPRYHAHLLTAGAAAAAELAARFVAPGVRRVLDAGCGAGVYGAACLAARPDVLVTFVDAPPALAAARAHLAGRPALAGRAAFVAGDLRCAPLAPTHDVAVLANVLHLLDPPAAAAVVGAVAAALVPGGTLVVKDLAIAADRRGPDTALYFALNMALYTDGGDVYTEAEVLAWLTAAGLAAARREVLAASPGSLVLVARRAGAGTHPTP
jgi:demethylspheroidene O-methyltransferase